MDLTISESSNKIFEIPLIPFLDESPNITISKGKVRLEPVDDD
ncbi:34164_t:CDS:1, partial [Gigaspora margarita]